MAIALADTWALTTASAGTRTVSGTATAAGACIVVPVAIRSDTATITVTDNGSNVYTAVTDTAGGADGDLFTMRLFYCVNAASTTQITATASEAVAIHAGALILTGIDNADPFDVSNAGAAASGLSWPAETVTPALTDNIVIGLAGLPATTRTLSQMNVAYTSLTASSANQLRMDVAYDIGAGTSTTGPQWDITSGSASNGHLLTVALNASAGGPATLVVDVGSDQSIFLGQSATITAVVTGGDGTSTGSWTKVSGPAGSILNAGTLSTTYTPSAVGTHVLRYTAVDSPQTAQDDLTITVSEVPAFVTIASVASSTGWTATGGTVQQVLSDSSDSTLVTSPESPTGSVIDVTFNSITLTEGQPLRLRMRARRADATTGTVIAKLYEGATLLSTSSATTVESAIGDITISFPAADFAAVIMPATFRVVTEWTAAA